jgi:hypothetical protein
MWGMIRAPVGNITIRTWVELQCIHVAAVQSARLGLTQTPVRCNCGSETGPSSTDFTSRNSCPVLARLYRFSDQVHPKLSLPWRTNGATRRTCRHLWAMSGLLDLPNCDLGE